MTKNKKEEENYEENGKQEIRRVIKVLLKFDNFLILLCVS